MERTIHYQEALLTANNIVQYDDTVAHPAFEEACEKFRNTCYSIQNLLGIEVFHGGYDEIEAYKDRAEMQTDEGYKLKDDLNLYNSLCIHEGQKIGMPPPYWFMKCWGINW